MNSEQITTFHNKMSQMLMSVLVTIVTLHFWPYSLGRNQSVFVFVKISHIRLLDQDYQPVSNSVEHGHNQG